MTLIYIFVGRPRGVDFSVIWVFGSLVALISRIIMLQQEDFTQFQVFMRGNTVLQIYYLNGFSFYDHVEVYRHGSWNAGMLICKLPEDHEWEVHGSLHRSVRSYL